MANFDCHNNVNTFSVNSQASAFLSEQSDSFEMANAIIETMTNNFQPCNYYDISNQLPVTKLDKQFLLHLNIRSLNKNLKTVNTDILQILPYSPDVICFTETKNKTFAFD